MKIFRRIAVASVASKRKGNPFGVVFAQMWTSLQNRANWFMACGPFIEFDSFTHSRGAQRSVRLAATHEFDLPSIMIMIGWRELVYVERKEYFFFFRNRRRLIERPAFDVDRHMFTIWRESWNHVRLKRVWLFWFLFDVTVVAGLQIKSQNMSVGQTFANFFFCHNGIWGERQKLYKIFIWLIC